MTRSRRIVGVDHSWLKQFDVEGPFLSLPVVKGFWPSGVERLGDTDDRLVVFKQAFTEWLRAYDQQSRERRDHYQVIAAAWVDTVLDELAEWGDLRIEADQLPAEWQVHSPGEQVRVRADGALKGRDDDDVVALLRVAAPSEDLRGPGLDGWAASEIDRMAALLRVAGVPIGIVTDGRWWVVVWAKEGKPTGSGVVDAVTWGEEPLLRDAFFTFVNRRCLRAKDPEHRLARLLERSELEAEEITEALGTQVRKSVELLVQAFSEARLDAVANGDPDPLTAKPDDVYQAAVTIMMRVVFLLFAEERGMLPTERLYWDSYAIRDLVDGLKEQTLAHGEEHLDESHDAWHRLLAVSTALFSGVNYDEMRMPAYGGSLLDPARFPWLAATDERGLRVQVSDRVMMHVLKSVQEAVVGGESRRISFREVDVEQIGYIYEGLLGYTCATVSDEVVVGLVGKDGVEPEIPLPKLNELWDASRDTRDFADKLIDWAKNDQPAAISKTKAQLVRLVDGVADKPELRRLLTPVAGHDPQLLADLIRWGNLIRRDLRNIPMVISPGGLVVEETPSRRNAGAHYTPKLLAEDVVRYALEPLVYEPGPLQTNNDKAWKLRSSSAILDLKVADIAAGSGAFLVAAARFLGKRVHEAWIAEGLISEIERHNPKLARERAIREVVARCLYGADINAMAVEMCKLSLWLVSLDKSKPFSFVDDKIFCGNSLLGVTSDDQLRRLHIYPQRRPDYKQPFVDVEGVLQEASRLRRQIASTVDEDDPQRSTDGKTRMLKQAESVTAKLRLLADGIVAAGLYQAGGSSGTVLDDAYRALSGRAQEAFPNVGTGDCSKLDEIIDLGLTPQVDTDYERWRPLHWAIEVPDVMNRGGFDAIVGNPPFLGGQKLTGALGVNVRDWLVSVIAEGTRGSADLVAYFLLRARSLISSDGTLGVIATNTVAQGDTREVGLERLVSSGFEIIRSIQSRSWPATGANLEYSAIWGTLRHVSDRVVRVSDGSPVKRISTLLEPAGRVPGQPRRLAENANVAYIGCYVLGMGFVLDPEEAQNWIAADASNADVLHPYLNGEDLNSRHDCTARRWVIDFNDRSEADARAYKLPYKRVLEAVKPERQRKRPDGLFALRRPLPERWWQYAEKRPAMRRAIADLSEALVISRVSKTVMPVRVPTRQIPSERTVVFATDSFGDQAVLSSNLHQMWAIKYGATLRTDAVYTPSDVFETMPRPEPTEELAEVGKALDSLRRTIMLRRAVGLTALYNLVNKPEVKTDADITGLREVHVEIDETVMAAYGWGDIRLDHGFHTYRQVERFTVSPTARVEILDRLLAENHRRAGIPEAQESITQEGLF